MDLAVTRAHPHDSGYIAPSLDLVAQSHRLLPHSDWLPADASAPVAADGLIGAQARIWSVDRRLVASGGGQLLCRPVPPR